VHRENARQMTGEGEHCLRKLDITSASAGRRKRCEIRRAIIAGIETIGFGLLKAGNHGLGACFSMPLSSHNGGERIGCRSLLGYAAGAAGAAGSVLMPAIGGSPAHNEGRSSVSQSRTYIGKETGLCEQVRGREGEPPDERD
jgi:hypothetical protein